MGAETLRGRWAHDEAAYGAAIRLDSPLAVETIALSGVDFVLLDQQHGLFGDALLLPMLHAVGRSDAAVVVRVPDNSVSAIQRVLDAGADGVIVPMVETVEEATRAARALAFGPTGLRSFGSTRIKHLPGGADRDVICLAMIETPTGVQNAREIMAVPGIDGAFVGPNDLALGLGLERSSGLHSEQLRSSVDAIATACRDNGKIVGGTGAPAEMKDLGYRFISVGGDHLFLEAGLKKALAPITDVLAARRGDEDGQR
jgi:4-hydroxy-2-oxoheptanedioate aldolase